MDAKNVLLRAPRLASVLPSLPDQALIFPRYFIPTFISQNLASLPSLAFLSPHRRPLITALYLGVPPPHRPGSRNPPAPCSPTLDAAANWMQHYLLISRVSASKQDMSGEATRG
ncbi:hypothetical protein E2C01_042113 [Portunus trituberculatus]|uniref:Uncharacterized protein n=1 Tax=Portunus trituberculatus TaxID=210409 RepID=A0A5B7FVK2_PORTR|nr:hypothetical protein [Portunus trituberculatus]